MNAIFSKSNIKYIVIALVVINAGLAYRHTLEALIIFYEHLAIALFGAFLWCYGLFRNSKNKAEKALKDFDWPTYKKQNWEDWGWSFLFCFPLVWFMKDFIELMNKVYELPQYDGYYLLAGPLSIAAGYGINWVLNKFDL